MIDIDKAKAIILDYGGTIDTNGVHWSAVLRMAYNTLNIPVSDLMFRNAYIHGERTLATRRIIEPHHNFWHVLRFKAAEQIKFLIAQEVLQPRHIALAPNIADWCYAYAQIAVNAAIPALKQLSDIRALVLVTNFYGNIRAVLEDFHLATFFPHIVESATAGVRKPDPSIFRMGALAAGCDPWETIVVGDSYEKDIAPAASIGCQTIWLRKVGWTENEVKQPASAEISSFGELPLILGAEPEDLT
jgi:putative hydrolase of the HAD superfamily